MKAIETQYKGYRFRSRLEARWAVFFDKAGISWRYEEQGYECDGGRYLPDFRIYRNDVRRDVDETPTDLFVEVKGDPLGLQKEWSKHAMLHDFGGCLPNFSDSYKSNPPAGLLLLGDIPQPGEGFTHFHPIIQHHKGLVRSWAFFASSQPTPIVVVEDSYLTGLMEIDPLHGLDCGEEGWEVVTRSRKLNRYLINTDRAYKAARSARFEHGETPC